MASAEINTTGRVRRALLLLAAIFIAISLYTYDPLDMGLYTSDPNSPAANRTGMIGAFVSGYILYLPLGLSAWIVPVFMFLWAADAECGWGKAGALKKGGGSLITLFSASALFSLGSIDTSSGYFLPGGVAGFRLTAVMLPLLGGWGSIIILSGAVAVGFLQAVGPGALKFTAAAAQAVKFLLRTSCKGIKKLMTRKPASAREPSIPAARENLPAPAPAEKPAEKTAVISFKRKNTARTERKPPETSGNFKLPPLELLTVPKGNIKQNTEDITGKIQILQDALQSYGVNCRVGDVNIGPIVSSFEVEPSRGVKLSQITSLADDIALVMKTQSVRISPIPGKSVVGIEVPNKNPRFVHLREVLESREFNAAASPLTLGLGTDIFGKPLAANLTEMPHLLVAGTTGSGKTICLNAIILSILFNASPEQVKFMMVDPKRVELNVFEKLPHLIAPVVTNSKKAARALKWVVEEMDKRYFMLSKAGVRNIASYNKLINGSGDKMPSLVVVIDELHDLMLVAQSAVEEAITRLAQLSRAVGIHLVIATQRPSVDVITGVIKANLSCRISFQVSSKTDSRTILDANGAERLIGKGDMLFLPPGKGTLIRAQCSLVSDEETRAVADFLKKQRPPDYTAELPEDSPGQDFDSFRPDAGSSDDDELYEEAVKIVMNSGKGSTSLLQRRLNIGYSRAARLLDMMEDRGIISPSRGTKPRTLLKQQEEPEE